MQHEHLPPGPWSDEPDRIEFEHAGFTCLMRRNPHMGFWCGYVGVPPGHPWHSKTYQELEEVEVHGGLTYSEACDGDPTGGVCHVPKPGEPEHLWWLGFNCGHGGDLVPSWCRTPEIADLMGGTYRDQEWVTEEVKRLAEQAQGANA